MMMMMSHSESSSSIHATGKRTPYQFLKLKGAKLQEKLKRIRSVPSKNQLMSRVETNEKEIAKVWLILDSFPHIHRLIEMSLIC